MEIRHWQSIIRRNANQISLLEHSLVYYRLHEEYLQRTKRQIVKLTEIQKACKKELAKVIDKQRYIAKLRKQCKEYRQNKFSVVEIDCPK